MRRGAWNAGLHRLEWMLDVYVEATQPFNGLAISRTPYATNRLHNQKNNLDNTDVSRYRWQRAVSPSIPTCKLHVTDGQVNQLIINRFQATDR